MTDNLPDVVREKREIARTDTDSWISVLGDVAGLAQKISGTEFVPKNLRNNVAATAAAILYGREVGLPPMTTLTQTHVIEGKPAMSAEAMRAMVFAAGHTIVPEETTGARCVMRGKRAGTDEWTTIVWTLDMARAAGVANKQVWKSYPRQMLQARATTELCRLLFPDVIHGFRSVEEFDVLEGVVVEDAEGNTAPAAASTKVTRKRTTTRKAPAPAPAAPSLPAAAPEDEGPPLPGDETSAGESAQGEGKGSPVDQDRSGAAPVGAAPVGSDAAPELDEDDAEIVDAEIIDELTKPPAEDEKPVPPATSTRAQHRMLFALLDKLDVKGDDDRLHVTSGLVGRPIDSFNSLTKREAGTLIETLPRCKTRADLDALIEATEERS